MSKPVKTIPPFATEAEERTFWESHNSADYVDWSKAQRAALPNLRPSTKTISLRLPEHLLDSIKAAANARDVPYQSLMKIWLRKSCTANDRIRSPGGRKGQPSPLAIPRQAL